MKPPTREISPDRTAIDDRVRQRLARSLGPTRYERYFERHTRLDFEQGSLRVSVPSAFHADWLDRRFGRSVREALALEAGADTPLRWSVDPTVFEREERDLDGAGATDAPALDGATDGAPARRASDARRPYALRANAPQPLRHSLDAFIVGPTTRLAHRVALQVAEQDDAPVSVLFLHGPCGVGKTHLLQGIAKRYAQRRTGARVRYVSGEAFANQFIASVHAGNIESFRERYRGVDLLCIDDVHFLGGKAKTQSEFLHTFEALDLDGARVVLASDGHPRQIRDLHEGIVSRCLSGMVVRLDRPDRATRAMIVRTLFEKRGLRADDRAIEEIAARVSASVRELEGAVKRVEAYARLLPGDDEPCTTVSVDLVGRALGTERGARSRPVRLEEVLDASCAEVGVTRDEVLSHSRHQRVVLARGMVGLVARAVTSHSFPEIARAIGRRNHSTVITACHRLERQIRDRAHIRLTPGGGEVPIADVFDRVKARLQHEDS